MKLGNLMDLPWYSRLGVFIGMSLLVYGGFWYFVTSGTRAETQALKEQIAVLEKENAQAQMAQQRLNEFRAAYKLRQQEYDDLRALLPDQRELTNVLQGVQDRARSSNLSLRRFSPKDDVTKEFYNGKPIEVQVTSTFKNLRGFFDQMAKYQRIVSITDFKLSRLDDKEQNSSKTIDSQFLLTAYYVAPQPTQPAPAKPGAPAPAAAQAPPAGAPAPAAK